MGLRPRTQHAVFGLPPWTFFPNPLDLVIKFDFYNSSNPIILTNAMCLLRLLALAL